MSDPSTVRKPPRESSSGSVAGETERIPISRREVGEWFLMERDQG